MKTANAKLQFELKNGQIFEFDVIWHDNSLIESPSKNLKDKIVNRVYFSSEFKHFFDIGIKQKNVFLSQNSSINSKVYFEDIMAVLSSEIAPNF